MTPALARAVESGYARQHARITDTRRGSSEADKMVGNKQKMCCLHRERAGVAAGPPNARADE